MLAAAAHRHDTFPIAPAARGESSSQIQLPQPTPALPFDLRGQYTRAPPIKSMKLNSAFKGPRRRRLIVLLLLCSRRRRRRRRPLEKAKIRVSAAGKENEMNFAPVVVVDRWPREPGGLGVVRPVQEGDAAQGRPLRRRPVRRRHRRHGHALWVSNF